MPWEKREGGGEHGNRAKVLVDVVIEVTLVEEEVDRVREREKRGRWGGKEVEKRNMEGRQVDIDIQKIEDGK